MTKDVEFSYGASGNRLSKTVDDTPDDNEDGVATYFVSDRSDVLLEFVDADGSGDASEPILVHRYLHGPGVDQILASEDGDGETLWHLTDHLGTVRDLVDNDGEVLNHLVYDSFGNVVSQTDETVGSRYRFTGREFDEETGLYYYRARYYDGDVGRFISSDPIGFAGGDVNLYRYVGNSPVDRVDPSGLASMELTALLNQACGSTQKGGTCDKYPLQTDYLTALGTATAWFYVITDINSRATFQSPNLGDILTADLKGGGNANLRLEGFSGPYPTIGIGKHKTPAREKVKEVKFKYTGGGACPATLPKTQPIIEPFFDPVTGQPTYPPTPTPTPAPAPAPVPAPAPIEWPDIDFPWFPIPIPRFDPFRQPV